MAIELFSQCFREIQARLVQRPAGIHPASSWEALATRFPAIWIADGSSLEELRRQLNALRER